MTVWDRHGWLLLPLILAILLVAAMLAAYPLPVLGVVGLAAGCWGVTTWHDKRHVTQARLRQRADYEHWCHINGYPAGMYGQFPPPRGLDDARRL